MNRTLQGLLIIALFIFISALPFALAGDFTAALYGALGMVVVFGLVGLGMAFHRRWPYLGENLFALCQCAVLIGAVGFGVYLIVNA